MTPLMVVLGFLVGGFVLREVLEILVNSHRNAMVNRVLVDYGERRDG